jgi:hypothetical protein
MVMGLLSVAPAPATIAIVEIPVPTVSVKLLAEHPGT